MMKNIATGLVLALLVAPALARAEEKSTTNTNTSTAQPTAKDAQKTGGNPMNTPDTEKSAAAGSRSASSADEKMTDARLVTLLQKVNKEEIEAGKLAQKRGKSAQVRKLGQTLITDHTRSQKEVAAAAKKAKISPSDSALTTKDREQEKIGKNKMDQLKKLNGAEFDKTFAQVMSNDHDHMISMLKDHKGDIRSEDLKTLVDNTLPVLEQHKDMADKAMSQDSRASAGSTQGRSGPGIDRSSTSESKDSSKSDTSTPPDKR